jgi:hypothetical protein
MRSRLAVLALVGVCLWGPEARSDTLTLQFPVDPANTGVVFKDFFVDLFSSDLNGTAVVGQSLSLNLVFNDDVLARLTLLNPEAFGVLLDISTNEEIFPGFAGPTTGFLLDANGKQIGPPLVAGRSSGDDGSFAFGIFFLSSANLDGDISGVHFDTSFPDQPGLFVTDAKLRFSLNDPGNGVEFGTEKQLSEPSTLGLTLVGVSLFALVAHRGISR